MVALSDFLDRLSSADPVPGGGSVAALQTAMAAALLAMVANLTIGKKRYAEVEQQVTDIRATAEALRDVALQLVDEDSEAYGRVGAALGLPRASDDEKAERRRAVQAALKDAARPPLETARVSIGVLELAGELVAIGNTAAISDVGTAALAARAGFHAARLNVEINVESVDDEAWVAGMRRELAALPDPDALERGVLTRTESVIRKAVN